MRQWCDKLDHFMETTSSSDQQKPPTEISVVDVWKTIASRRQSYDAMLWQTAGFALTAQSFLYVIALNRSNQPLARIVTFVLSIICGLATLQLMSKHRLHENEDARTLEKIEKENSWQSLHGQRDRSGQKCWLKPSSVKVWQILQLAFITVSLGLLIYTLCGGHALRSTTSSPEPLWPAGTGELQ